MSAENPIDPIKSAEPIKSNAAIEPAAPTETTAAQAGDAAPAEAAPNAYNEAMIRVLDDVEHVRTRPGMYIGGYNPRGLHHLVYEIVDNSIDEALAGFSKQIHVKINADGSCTVTDDGRGIPVGIHPTEKIPAVEVVFSTLGAGGKFEHSEETAYKTSGGLHGVGASVVNFVSEWMEIEVSREGAVHFMEYERGKKTSNLKVIGKTNKTGTKVTFKPDTTLFPDTNFIHETLLNRLRELAFLNAGVEIVFEDERVGKRDDFKFEKGLTEYVQFLNEGKTGLSTVVSFTKEDPTQKLVVEVAMQYNDGYNETILTFANNINNHDGGSHLSGFKTGLTNTILRYAERTNLLKDVRPSGDDLREGLVAVISVKIPEPQFESQTKDKLLNVEVESFMQTSMNERLSAFLEENPKEARAIFEKGMMAAEAREAARKARELTRRKNSLEGNALPGKLADCRSKSNEETEVFLVEGDSAGGTVKQGRDSNVQAVLALRGKILNVEKANLVKMLGHEEIRTIISALGCGIRDDFNMEKRRYGKIIIMTDADVDGSHIRTLLLTFFFRHMQELIRDGRIYVAQPPLYQITRKKKDEYILNEREMRSIYTTLGLDGTELIVRDPDDAMKETGRITGPELLRVVGLLNKLEELVTIIRRRGIDFAEVLAYRSQKGELPRYHMIVDGEQKLMNVAQRDQMLEDQQVVIEDATPAGDANAKANAVTGESAGASATGDGKTTAAKSKGAANANGKNAASENANVAPASAVPAPPRKGAERLQKSVELHELKEAEELFAQLEKSSLMIADYFLTQEESVTGEKLPTKYALQQEQKVTDVAGVAQLLPAVHALGKHGIEVKRFKGLGEMNADQLWETTLDPTKRVLMRITLTEAGEAERMFSVLMGEDVERRRQFIEDHALEVKNLDV